MAVAPAAIACMVMTGLGPGTHDFGVSDNIGHRWQGHTSRQRRWALDPKRAWLSIQFWSQRDLFRL